MQMYALETRNFAVSNQKTPVCKLFTFSSFSCPRLHPRGSKRVERVYDVQPNDYLWSPKQWKHVDESVYHLSWTAPFGRAQLPEYIKRPEYSLIWRSTIAWLMDGRKQSSWLHADSDEFYTDCFKRLYLSVHTLSPNHTQTTTLAADSIRSPQWSNPFRFITSNNLIVLWIHWFHHHFTSIICIIYNSQRNTVHLLRGGSVPLIFCLWSRRLLSNTTSIASTWSNQGIKMSMVLLAVNWFERRSFVCHALRSRAKAAWRQMYDSSVLFSMLIQLFLFVMDFHLISFPLIVMMYLVWCDTT